MTHFTKPLVIIMALLAFFSEVKAQSSPAKPAPSSATTVQIPEEFWDFPLRYFGDSAGLVLNRMLKNAVTPRMLFKQMKFYTEKQLDGKERKSEVIKTELKGNNVMFTIRTTANGNIFFAELGIYCDLANKQNTISSLSYNTQYSKDPPIYFKPLDYFDSASVAEFEVYYDQLYKVLAIWYGWDEINKWMF